MLSLEKDRGGISVNDRVLEEEKGVITAGGTETGDWIMEMSKQDVVHCNSKQ